MPSPRRRSIARSTLVAVAVCATLAACSSSGGQTSTGATSDPAATTPAPVATASGPIPEVTGGFGEPPKITIPEQSPADALVTKTLVTGKGATVNAGDLLVVNYVGETWDDGKVFDESFSRSAPTAFGIGVGRVIPGWDAALVGQTVGSRVVMAIPPDLGYGADGQPSAGIAADDTLVFVVDILGAYPPGSAPAASAKDTGVDLSGLPTVSGDLGAQPTLTVPAGTTPPTKAKAVVLAQGEGPALQSGSFVIVQYEAVDWSGASVGSTWEQGQLAGLSVGSLPPTPFDALIGQSVGSRVLLIVPADGVGDPATDSVAVVVDIIDAIPPAS